jgi:hypothetical protein
MIKLIFIFLLPLSLYSSKILSYNIYDRTDRVDIMITFDTPYNGQIKQSNSSSIISIKLQDSSIEAPKLQQLSSNLVHTLRITPMEGFTEIVLAVDSSVKLYASKTSDSYGLRLRFMNKALAPSTTTINEPIKSTKNISSTNLPTKKQNDFSKSYYIVVSILVIGIIILLLIKKRVTPKMFEQERKKAKEEEKSWLFKENTSDSVSVPTSGDSREVSIRFQKNLDTHNSVVMLDFAEQSYLLLIGNNNVLLDKYTEEKPKSQDEFDIILQDKHEKLESFLNTQDIIQPEEALQAYTQKASSISYEV